MTLLRLKIILAIAISLTGQMVTAQPKTNCVTGNSPSEDYCRTNVGGFFIVTGGQFGAPSIIFDGNWMLYEPNNSSRKCELIYDSARLTGEYKAKPWTDTTIQFPEIFEKKTGKKITKRSAPWAGCFFLAPDSYSILKSFDQNTRYKYVIEGRKDQNFYPSEITPLSGRSMLEVILQHSEISSDRTSVKNQAELKEALGVSYFDRVLDMTRKIFDLQ